jgi:hypothetical protein
MGNWKTWLNGLIGAFIGAASNTITLMIVDPLKFSPSVDGGWHNLLIVIAVSGAVGAALYLKTHPTPYDTTTVSQTTTQQTGTPAVTTTTVAATHVEPKS